MIVLTIEKEKLSIVNRERHNIIKKIDFVDEIDLFNLTILTILTISTWINHWFR